MTSRYKKFPNDKMYMKQWRKDNPNYHLGYKTNRVKNDVINLALVPKMVILNLSAICNNAVPFG